MTKRGLSGVLKASASSAGELGGALIDSMGLVRETVLAEDVGDCAKGRGFDKVGAHFEEALMHLADSVGAGEDDVFVAALVLRAAEVLGSEIEPLDIGAERAVDHEDALRQQLPKELYSSRVSQHQSLEIWLRRTSKFNPVTAALAI